MTTSASLENKDPLSQLAHQQQIQAEQECYSSDSDGCGGCNFWDTAIKVGIVFAAILGAVVLASVLSFTWPVLLGGAGLILGGILLAVLWNRCVPSSSQWGWRPSSPPTVLHPPRSSHSRGFNIGGWHIGFGQGHFPLSRRPVHPQGENRHHSRGWHQLFGSQHMYRSPQFTQNSSSSHSTTQHTGFGGGHVQTPPQQNPTPPQQVQTNLGTQNPVLRNPPPAQRVPPQPSQTHTGFGQGHVNSNIPPQQRPPVNMGPPSAPIQRNPPPHPTQGIRT